MLDFEFYKNDIPANLSFGSVLAMDCEMMGLNVHRDRLCLMQIWDGEQEKAHVIQFDGTDYSAPNLKKNVLSDADKMKIFYFCRGDMNWIGHWLGVVMENMYCTKIASRIAQTYTVPHELEAVAKRFLGVEISKEEQCTNWGAPELSESQLRYAVQDVEHLHAVREKLDEQLDQEGRKQLAYDMFACLPARVRLDLAGWREEDIFAY